MSDSRPKQCPKCGSPLVRLLDDAGQPVIVFGREKWVCERYDDPQGHCDYKSLRSAESEPQACCPHCGCAHLLDDKVTHSEVKGGTRRRRRICRNCGLPVFTREVVESSA